jgi:triosephosphate isomerase
MRRKLIAGNWKMHGSLSSNRRFFLEFTEGLKNEAKCDVLICPPAIYLDSCVEELSKSGVFVGAQDVSSHENGAYTGEVSASMLADIGCTYVIVGHSERRVFHRESNETVAQKVVQALRSGITPIVCVGENLAQHEAGLAIDVVSSQLRAVLDILDCGAIARIMVSYEPVWAIGTGKSASPEIAQGIHMELRKIFAERDPSIAQKVKILYGGSMKSGNAKSLLRMPDIDGGLIGGASLSVSEFLEIINAVE